MAISIQGIPLGRGRTFIVGELSANHNHSYDVAARTLEAMKRAGADGAKLQTYRPESLTMDCDNQYFPRLKGGLWDGRTLWDLYQEAHMPWEWQPRLKQVADDLGLVLFSTPFDFEAVSFLAGLDIPAYKIASFEIHDLPLIRRAAAVGRPMIISTGIAESQEIREALDACLSEGNEQIILLKCTSAYPAPLSDVNLLRIPGMAEEFQVPIGFSDHTIGPTAAVAAVALGAVMVEKHFILDRAMGGPDAAFSIEPDEFAEMVRMIRETELCLGTREAGLTDSQNAARKFRRSLFVSRDLKKGDILGEDSVRSIRSDQGLHPRYWSRILGRRTGRDVSRGTPLALDMLEPEAD